MDLDNKVGRDGVQCRLTSDAPICESPSCIFRLGYICCRKGLYLEIKQHSFVASNIRRQLPGGKGINLGHQEEEAHPVGGNRRICNPKIRKNSKK